MYNYYQQQPNVVTQMPQQPRQNIPIQFGGLKGHPVSSLEEVKATSIDFDGSIFYFPDIANKKIYTKTVGLDGIASLNMYELKPIPTEPIAGDYVTRQEFESAMIKISEILNNKQKQQTEQKSSDKEPGAPSNYKEVF